MKRRMTWMLVPALAIGMVACGSDSGESATAGTSSGSEQAATTEAASSGGGDSSSVWCQMATKLDEDMNLDDPNIFDPKEAQQAFDQVRDVINEAADAAPDEIKDDVATIRDGFDQYYQALDDADWNIMDVDETALTNIEDEMNAADENISRYNEEVCGIPSDSTDDSLIGADESGSTDTETDSTEATGTIREQMQQQFQDMGLTEEQAACVVDNLDFAEMTDSTDPTAMFDVFSKCDVDITDLGS